MRRSIGRDRRERIRYVRFDIGFYNYLKKKKNNTANTFSRIMPNRVANTKGVIKRNKLAISANNILRTFSPISCE